MSEFERALYVRLGKRMRLMRIKLGMTQADLAVELSISQSMIAQYEKGTRKMSIEMLQDISDVFNCTMDDLLGTQFSTEIEDSYEAQFYEFIQTNNLSEEDFKNILDYAEYYFSKKPKEPRKPDLMDVMNDAKLKSEETNKKRSSLSPVIPGKRLDKER